MIMTFINIWMWVQTSWLDLGEGAFERMLQKDGQMSRSVCMYVTAL